MVFGMVGIGKKMCNLTSEHPGGAPIVLDWDGFGKQNGCISTSFHVQLMQNMLFEIVFNCGENGVSYIEMGQE